MLKVSVGIPTHNEESNIKDLLISILSQKESNFSLLEILVVDDQSSDQTLNEVKSIVDPRVIVEVARQRGGKSARFHDLSKQFKGDVLIQFDADVRLADNLVIEGAVNTFLAENAQLVCLNIKALPPRTFSESLAYFGTQVWWGNVLDTLKQHSIVYRCQGRARLFSRAFLEKFNLPRTAGEDVYSFFFAIKNRFKVSFAEKAIVYYRLPSTWRDYIKQSKRFIRTAQGLQIYFSKELMKNYYGYTTFWIKFKAFLKSIFHVSPLVSCGYLLRQIYAHLFATSKDASALWKSVPSTKILK